MAFARKLLPGFPDCSAIDIFFKRAWNQDKNGVERSDWDLFKSDRIYPAHMEFVHSTIESLEGTREINVFIAFGADARKFVEERHGNGTTEVILNETLWIVIYLRHPSWFVRHASAWELHGYLPQFQPLIDTGTKVNLSVIHEMIEAKMRRDPLVDEMMPNDPAEKRAFLERSRIQTIRKRELTRARRQFSAVLQESTFSGFLRARSKKSKTVAKGFTGRKHSQATRDLMRAARKAQPARKHSQATKDKISKKRKLFETTKNKMAGLPATTSEDFGR